MLFYCDRRNQLCHLLFYSQFLIVDSKASHFSSFHPTRLTCLIAHIIESSTVNRINFTQAFITWLIFTQMIFSLSPQRLSCSFVIKFQRCWNRRHPVDHSLRLRHLREFNSLPSSGMLSVFNVSTTITHYPSAALLFLSTPFSTNKSSPMMHLDYWSATADSRICRTISCLTPLSSVNIKSSVHSAASHAFAAIPFIPPSVIHHQ